MSHGDRAIGPVLEFQRSKKLFEALRRGQFNWHGSSFLKKSRRSTPAGRQSGILKFACPFCGLGDYFISVERLILLD
jgi:hypothetical protein